jgi:hypothetical protein
LAVGRKNWVVWAQRGSILEHVRSAFTGVEDCDARVPHRSH